MANLMIVFSSDTEISKIFQQQVSRKNEKKLTASPIELVQTAIEKTIIQAIFKVHKQKNDFLKIFYLKRGGSTLKDSTTYDKAALGEKNH